MTGSDLDRRPPEGDWLGTPFLRFERQGPIGVVTVDRPERRNALTPAMYFGIRYAVDHVNRTPELAGLIVTGVDDVFIPGGDLGGGTDDGWADLPTLLAMDNTPFDTIRHSAKPVVSAVNGIAQGGGMMIAMVSDVAVASDRATFRCPELLRGIADTNYAQILPRQVGPARARDLLLTGRTLDAAEALEWGLITRVAPHGDVLEAAHAVMRDLCQAAPDARLACKRVMDDYYGAYDRMSMDASLRGPEMVEGYRAFKEGRAPGWVPEAFRSDERL